MSREVLWRGLQPAASRLVSTLFVAAAQFRKRSRRVSTRQAGVPAPRKRAHRKFPDIRSSESRRGTLSVCATRAAEARARPHLGKRLRSAAEAATRKAHRSRPVRRRSACRMPRVPYRATGPRQGQEILACPYPSIVWQSPADSPKVGECGPIRTGAPCFRCISPCWPAWSSRAWRSAIRFKCTGRPRD